MTMVADDMTYTRYLAMWRSDLDGPREWKHDRNSRRPRAMLKGRCIACFADTDQDWKNLCSVCYRDQC